MGFQLAKDYAVLRKSVFDQICTYLKIKLPDENWPFLKTRASELLKDKNRKGQVLFIIEIALEINKCLEDPGSDSSKYIQTLTAAVLYICNEIQVTYDTTTSTFYGGKNNSDLFTHLRTSINMDSDFRKQLTDRQFEELYTNLTSFLNKRTFKTVDNKIHPDNGFIIPPVFTVEQFSVPNALIILTRNMSKYRIASLDVALKQWQAGPMTSNSNSGYDPSMFSKNSPPMSGGSGVIPKDDNEHGLTK